MRNGRGLCSLAFLFAFLVSQLSLADNSSRLVKIGTDFKSYSFSKTPSFGFKAAFSWTQSSDWAIRLGGYELQKFGENSVQGALGGSYWITPAWVLELDADIATRSAILPFFSGTVATSVTISKVATPLISFQYSQYIDATSFNLTPGLDLSLIPELELSARLFAGITTFPTGKLAATISGGARLNFMPFDYFSLFTALNVGEEPFDPGDPAMPLSRYFSEKVSGGLKFTMEGHIGAELGLGHEWRNNGQTVFGGDLSLFCTW